MKLERVLALAAALLMACTVHAQTSRSQRVALVIGNDTYQQLTPLKNARADAQAIAQALRRAGFQVQLQLDAGEKAMKAALRTFKGQVRGGDEAVFFYSGHAVQFANTNYLLPVDIKGDSEDQIKDDAIPLQRVLDDLQDQKARFTLAIVDACRDNPFRKTGRAIGGRGLAPTTAATGQMVIYSAGAGQQALDQLNPGDPDPNGLFTRVFLKEMNQPGVPVDRVLRNVRDEVVRLARSVGHEQVPALYDQALGDFFFVPAAGGTPTAANPMPPPAAPSSGRINLDDLRQRARWDKWQADMQADFDTIAAAEPGLQVAGWDRFLASYSQKNPYSQTDEQLRAEARSRKAQAQAQQRSAKDAGGAPPVQTASSVRPPAAGIRDAERGPSSGQPTTRSERPIAAPAEPSSQSAPPAAQTVAIASPTAAGNQIVFDDGTVYRGAIRSGRPHGQGTYSAKGQTYEGDYVDGIKQGRGKYVWASGDRYEGMFANDQPEGTGSYQFASGDVYEGEMKQGRINGRGVWRKKSGETMQGVFADAKLFGRAVYRFPNGDRYEGEMTDGRIEGAGTFFSQNGDVIKSAFVDGKAHGKGTYEYASGARYEGEFAHGLPQGTGVYWFGNGSRFEGTFEQGILRAHGFLIRGDGSRSAAEIVNGQTRMAE